MKTKTILLVHGMFMTPLCWEKWIPYYSSKGYNVVAPAWPMRDKPVELLNKMHPDPGLPKLNLNGVVEQMEREVAKLGEKPAVIGHSMGGRIAFEMMQLAPERILRLALLDTSCHALPEGAAGERERQERARLVGLARAEGVRAMALSWMSTMLHPSSLEDAALAESIARMFERKTADIFAAQIKALLDRAEVFPILANIRCPTLVLAGRADRLSRPEANREMAEAIPGSHLVILEDCGHMAPQERPGEVNRCLSEWLDS